MNQFMVKYLGKIVNIPGPSGFTSRLMEVLGDDARDMGYEVSSYGTQIWQAMEALKSHFHYLPY